MAKATEEQSVAGFLEQLVQDLRDMGRAAWNLGDVAGIIRKVCEESRAGDLIVIMSNGGFGGIYEQLPAALQAAGPGVPAKSEIRQKQDV